MNDVFSRIVSLCPLLLRVSVIEQEEQLELHLLSFLFLFSILHLRSRLLLGECDYLVDIFCNPGL